MSKKEITLLYAEDENNIRENYTQYMNLFVKTIYEAKNGEEALDLFEKNNPDIVLLDIEMPKLNGLEVAQRIREQNPKTRIIFLTAYSETPKLLTAIRTKATDYLIKPINRSDLKRVLLETIEEIKNQQTEEDFINLDPEGVYRLNVESALVYKDRELLELTKYEIALLKFFSSQPNQVVSKIDLFNYVWDDFDKEYSDVSVRNLIKNIRRKLPDGLIESIYGGGYIFKI